MAKEVLKEMSAVRKRKRVLFGGYFLIILTFALIGAVQTGHAVDFFGFFLRYLAFFAVVLIWTTVALIGASED
jgi:hypothetical protein